MQFDVLCGVVGSSVGDVGQCDSGDDVRHRPAWRWSYFREPALSLLDIVRYPVL